MNFCIEKMNVEELGLINIQSRLGSPNFRNSDLIFGGVRHQSAAYYGIEPSIGEECYIERRWRAKDGKYEARFAGKEGNTHLVNSQGLSYGILMQSDKKIRQLQLLGTKEIHTNQEVKEKDEYFNPFLKYIITDIIRDGDVIHFVSVKAEVI